MKPTHASIASILIAASLAMAGGARVATIDGQETSGKWIGYSSAGVQLRTDQGVETIPAADLADVIFDGNAPEAPAPRPGAAPTEMRFQLADGSSLTGQLVDGDQSGVLTRTALGGQTRFRFDDLAAIVFGTDGAAADADALVNAALAERRAGRDLLITADDPPKSVPGTLLALDGDGGTFRFGARDRRFSYQKIHAIVFARSAIPPSPPPHRLTFVGGESMAGELVVADESVLTVAGYGQNFEVPVDRLVSIVVSNPRVTHLGSLEPIAVERAGLVHRDWPYRRDRNVGNRPLRLGGRTYTRGLGVHARSSLSYALEGAFARFAATIGLDDAVGDGGCVQFIVLLDDREIFRSQEMTGVHDPVAIMLDVSGGQTLTLTVAFAGNADVGDWANWANARLIRPE